MIAQCSMSKWSMNRRAQCPLVLLLSQHPSLYSSSSFGIGWATCRISSSTSLSVSSTCRQAKIWRGEPTWWFHRPRWSSSTCIYACRQGPKCTSNAWLVVEMRWKKLRKSASRAPMPKLYRGTRRAPCAGPLLVFTTNTLPVADFGCRPCFRLQSWHRPKQMHLPTFFCRQRRIRLRRLWTKNACRCCTVKTASKVH